MSTLEERAAEAKAKMQGSNPSAEGGKKPVAERQRIPLTLPVQKFAVPEIPGYHLHWFRGTPERLAQAERAGYEFVNEDEVDINSVQLGGDATKGGNTDLGTRVSVVAGGGDTEGGQPTRMYLMKQKMEWYVEDQKLLENRNDGVAEALTAAFRTGTVGGKADGETSADMAQRYVDPKRARMPDLFRKKSKR